MTSAPKQNRSIRLRSTVLAVGLSLGAATAAGCSSGLARGGDPTVLGPGESFEVVVATADGAVVEIATADGSSGDGGGAKASDGPLTDPATLDKLVALPGDPVGVWYWSVPMGTIDENTRVPGPTDYAFYAVVEYETPEIAAAVAGPEVDTDEILVDDWYPQELIELGHQGQWDRSWMNVSVHQPESAWANPVYVVADAPRYIVFSYADATN